MALIIRFLIRALLFLLLGAVPADAVFCQCALYNAGPAGWHTLHIGGGGYLVNGNQSADGLTTVARGDVYGGYVSYNGSSWTDVVNATAVPSSIYAASGFATTSPGTGRGGPYELVTAPNSDSTLYMMWMGELMVSTASPPTAPSFSICGGWSQLTLNYSIDGNNGPYRFIGPHFAVDPNNANVAYFGTPKNGVYTTANGCSSSSSISTSTIPAAGSVSCSAFSTCYPGYVIVFDANGGTTGGKTNNIYVGGWGNHIYASFNAGSSWASLSSGPSSGTWSMSVCPSGNLWAVSSSVDYAGGNYNLWKYSGGSGGTWTQMTDTAMGTLNSAAQAVACDPNNSSHVVVTDVDGNPNWTSNAGTSWSGNYQGSQSQTATDVPWLAWLSAHGAADGQLSPGTIFFDNATANKLWMTSGFGVWYAANMSTSLGAPGTGTVAWTSFTAGTEVQDAIGVTSPPNGNGSVILNAEQFNWYISNTNTQSNPYPANGTPSGVPATCGSGWGSLAPGWASDYVGGTPATVVGMLNGLFTGTCATTDDYSWISTNSGATATYFASQTGAAPTGRYGGSIAAASASVILQLASSLGPYITTNGGSSWSAITIPGATGGSAWGTGGAFSLSLNSCADKVSNGTLYLMNTTDGLYVSTDGAGATWNLATMTGLTVSAGFITKLICVPKLGSVNTAGHLIWNPGNASSANPVYFSNNQGGSWVRIPNITGAWSVGVGAPKPGGNGYPVIWAIGTVNSVFGVYHCDNYNSASNTGCANSDWVNVGTWPNNDLDAPYGIDGDQNTYGRAYVSFQGSGFAQFNYLLWRDIDPASNDNTPVGVARVS